MRRKSVYPSMVLFAVLGLLVTDASAQLFGSDDDKMELLLREVKKLNTRLVEKVIPKMDQNREEMKKLRNDMNWIKSEVKQIKSANRNLSQSLETLEGAIPPMQATMERAQADTAQQIQKLDKNLMQSAKKQEEGWSLVKQEIGANLKGVKDGIAKDVENMGNLNQKSFDKLIASNQGNLVGMEKQIVKALNSQGSRMDKSVAVMTEIAKSGSKDSETLASLQTSLAENNKALSEQNKKIIDILGKNLKEQEMAAAKMDSLGGNQAQSSENVKQTMVALKGIVDSRLEEISKAQQTLLTQTDQASQNTVLVKENLLVADQKINQLAEGMKTIQGQSMQTEAAVTQAQTQITQLHDLSIETDQKFTTLIETTKDMLTNASEVNQKVDSSLMKLDEGRTEIDLTSEKITKLIEILKAIAEEQGKLEQLVASVAGEGDKKAIMKALEDLRRKANVNIARNDSILKKLRGK